MRISGFAWECSCGHMEYGEETPEECGKCGSLDTFLKMPEDLLKAREQDLLLEGDDDEAPVKVMKTKAPKTVKAKKTTTRSKKK